MTDKIVLLSTCASPEEAERVARRLVESRLAACVNIVPAVRSIYRWQGAIEDSVEVLLVIKSRRELLDAIRRAVEETHSYSVPELVALPIVGGNEAYLDWIDQETR